MAASRPAASKPEASQITFGGPALTAPQTSWYEHAAIAGGTAIKGTDGGKRCDDCGGVYISGQGTPRVVKVGDTALASCVGNLKHYLDSGRASTS